MMDHIPISFIFTLYRYLSTSRGAGNRISLAIEAQSWYSIDTYLSTSREDGNWISSKCWIWFVVSIIPIYLERGRKQLIFSFLVPSFFVYLPIYLERGRKRIYCVLSQNFYDRSDTYLPREGPETQERWYNHRTCFRVYLPINLERGRKRKVFLSLCAVLYIFV